MNKELTRYSVEELLAHIAEVSEKKLTTVQSPTETITYLKARLTNNRIEKFLCLFLDSRNKIIGEKVFDGTINKAIIYPREVAREALLQDAVSVIVAHNHPSGECDPSGNDIHLTTLICDALKSLDIKLLDHIIIGSVEKTFSFAEESLL